MFELFQGKREDGFGYKHKEMTAVIPKDEEGQILIPNERRLSSKELRSDLNQLFSKDDSLLYEMPQEGIAIQDKRLNSFIQKAIKKGEFKSDGIITDAYTHAPVVEKYIASIAEMYNIDQKRGRGVKSRILYFSTFLKDTNRDPIAGKLGKLMILSTFINQSIYTQVLQLNPELFYSIFMLEREREFHNFPYGESSSNILYQDTNEIDTRSPNMIKRGKLSDAEMRCSEPNPLIDYFNKEHHLRASEIIHMFFFFSINSAYLTEGGVTLQKNEKNDMFLEFLKSTNKISELDNPLMELSDVQFCSNIFFYLLLLFNYGLEYSEHINISKFVERINMLSEELFYESEELDKSFGYFFSGLGVSGVNPTTKMEIGEEDKPLIHALFGDNKMSQVYLNNHFKSAKLMRLVSVENEAKEVVLSSTLKLQEKDIVIDKLRKTLAIKDKKNNKLSKKFKTEKNDMVEKISTLQERDRQEAFEIQKLKQEIDNLKKKLAELTAKEGITKNTTATFNFILREEKDEEEQGTKIDISPYKKILLISFLKRDKRLLPERIDQFNEIDKINQLKNIIKGYDLVLIDSDKISHSSVHVIKAMKVKYFFMEREMFDEENTP